MEIKSRKFPTFIFWEILCDFARLCSCECVHILFTHNIIQNLQLHVTETELKIFGEKLAVVILSNLKYRSSIQWLKWSQSYRWLSFLLPLLSSVLSLAVFPLWFIFFCVFSLPGVTSLCYGLHSPQQLSVTREISVHNTKMKAGFFLDHFSRNPRKDFDCLSHWISTLCYSNHQNYECYGIR